MKSYLNIILEIVLFSFLVLLPFSHQELTHKWLILTIPVIVFLIYLQISKPTYFNLEIFYTLLVMIIFSFIEKINIIQKLNIPVELSRQIPVSTILLAIGMFILLLKILIEGKFYMTEHPLATYFFYASIFVIFMTVLFYPFMYWTYQMKLDSIIHFLNRIFKYLIIFLMGINYISTLEKNKLKRFNIGLILSLSATVILHILL
jgi:hypothetical protein